MVAGRASPNRETCTEVERMREHMPPSAAEKIEQLARESERLKMEVERLKSENSKLLELLKAHKGE